MGVKSTARLTRAEAVRRATNLRLDELRQEIEASFVAMSDEDLENALEDMNDRAHGGEGFDNFLITGSPTPGYR